nr:M56 family metallopeptidase [Nakamurella flavida]
MTAPSPFTGGGAREAAADVSILDHDRAVAYTLPGFHARIVLSVGMLDLLDVDQLGAVVEHERAHLRSRHDLLALPFQAWAAALGRVPGVRPARRAVAELTEMLADDAACTRSSQATLAAALARVALADGGRSANRPAAAAELPTASGAAEVDGVQITRRVRRLLDPAPLPGAVTALVYLAAAALLSVPPVLLLLGW